MKGYPDEAFAVSKAGSAYVPKLTEPYHFRVLDGEIPYLDLAKVENQWFWILLGT